MELSNRVEQRGLRWFGHMERMNEERMMKRIYNRVSSREGEEQEADLRWGGGRKLEIVCVQEKCHWRNDEL